MSGLEALCDDVRSRPSAFLIPLLFGGLVLGGSCPLWAQVGFDRLAPSTTYHAVFLDYYDGEFGDALESFQDEWRGAIKTPQSRWIDSICYHTMIGECYYQMGRLDEAQQNYAAAIRLYLSFPDWLRRLDFPPAIRAAQPQSIERVPWGESTRRSRVGYYPTKVLMRQGRIDHRDAIRQGGMIQQAMLYPVQAQEIVRCTTLAIRRRTELLGPLCRHDPLTADLITVLSGNPGQPNHWSQAWIDVQLGCALIAGGRQAQAFLPLSRGIVAAGEFDHPLTPTALLELGRLALFRGDYTNASTFFREATIAAVRFPDYGILEEAFRYGALTHLAANRQGVIPELELAAAWARRKDLRVLRVSLLLSAAENLLVLGQTREAAAMLEEARATIGRRPMGAGRIGARLNYLNAIALFQQRNVSAGDDALAAAMNYMRQGSHWYYQIWHLDLLFTNGQINTRGPITPRTAMELYGELLRDPQATDWGLQPMESLAVLVTPHAESFQHWFRVALARSDHETALEITDRARRHRFFSSLAFGGRLQSLRWILEAPEELLDQQALLHRQDLLAQNPAYAKLSQQAGELRAALEKVPLVPKDNDAFQQLQGQLEQLGALSMYQEAVLREMAVRRNPAALVFPPLRSTKEIQKSLPEGQVLLAFFAAGSDLYAFLINRDQYGYWQVPGTPTLSRQLVELFRAMGHFEQNRQLSLKELEDPKWKEAARGVLDRILEGSRADFTADFPELVIVPDGIMWYVPFESLLVDMDGQLRPLIARFRIRYAPTLSLAVPHGRGLNPAAETAVVLGRLFPRDGDSVAQAAFDDLARVVPRSVALPKSPLPAPSALYASLIDHLIVLDDVQLEVPDPYGWAPIPIDRGKPGNTLSDWLALPWRGPAVVILPGYHTAAERALKGVRPAAAGNEMFLAVCGLMSSGARTLLISRWRSAGQTSFDFVREFTQELPHTAPADAFQRAVLVVADSRLNLDAEPRIKQASVAEPPKATHPFFWSPYMLVDSGVPPEKEEVEPEPPAVKFAPKLEEPKAEVPQPQRMENP